MAIRQGELVAEGIAHDSWETINYKSVPTTIFAPLEYSFVGWKEEEAIEKYGEDKIEVYHSSFNPLEWVYSENPQDSCYAKIIVHRETDEILGIHIMSPNSGEIIQGYALAVQCKLKYKEMKKMIGIHPTIGEELLAFKFTKRENSNPVKTGC